MKQKNIIIASIIVGVGIISAAFLLGSGSQNGTQGNSQNVREENGVQIVHILARGGYSPRQISVSAGVPIRIEMETNNTYDCSSVLVIPSMGYQKRLPPTGITIIDAPAQSSGSSLVGTCGMGMYSFEIKFN